MKKNSIIVTLILALCLCMVMAVPTFAADEQVQNEKVTLDEVLNTLMKLSYYSTSNYNGDLYNVTDENVNTISEEDIKNDLARLCQMTRSEFDKEIETYVKDIILLCINNENVRPSSSFVEYASNIYPEYNEVLENMLQPICLNDTLMPQADYAGNSAKGIQADYSFPVYGVVFSILMEVEWTWDTDNVITTLLPFTRTRVLSAFVDERKLTAPEPKRMNNGKQYYIYREAHCVLNFQSLDLHNFYPILKVWVNGGDWDLYFEQDCAE